MTSQCSCKILLLFRRSQNSIPGGRGVAKFADTSVVEILMPHAVLLANHWFICRDIFEKKLYTTERRFKSNFTEHVLCDGTTVIV